MPSPKSRNKSFTYWQARFKTEPYHRTFQELLKSAFDNTKIKDRLHPPENGEEGIQHLFINEKMEIQGYLCVSLFSYETGSSGHIIREAFDEDRVDPQALSAPEGPDGTKQQFLNGKLYAVCLENHLILCQDQVLTAKNLELYVAAMFHKHLSNADINVFFGRALSKKVRTHIKGIKGIQLSAPLARDEEPHDAPEASPSGIWRPITEMLRNLSSFKSIGRKGYLHPKDIQVSLGLSWQNKPGESMSDRTDRFANALRFVDDDVVDVELNTRAGKVKKDEIRLRKTESVPHENDMPISREIFKKMLAWHQELIKGEFISL